MSQCFSSINHQEVQRFAHLDFFRYTLILSTKLFDTNPKMTLRKLGKCWWETQILGILKAKEHILTLYEVNRSDILPSVGKKEGSIV